MDAGDFSTLSELYLTKKSFPECKVYRLLDKDTSTPIPEFEKYILFAEKQAATGLGAYPKDFKRDDLIRIVQTSLKPYQQVFWTHPPLVTSNQIAHINQSTPLSLIEMLHSPIGSLSATLALLGVVYDYDGQQLATGVHFHRVWINSIYKTKAIPYIPQLGTFTPKEIIQGIKKKQRLGATYFPLLPFAKQVHNSLEPPTTVIQHDRVHATILHQHGDAFMDVILRMVENLQAQNKMEISKEIWMIAEAVALTLMHTSERSLFLFLLDNQSRGNEMSIRSLLWNHAEQIPIPSLYTKKIPIIHTNEDVPTAALWLILLDIFDNAYLNQTNMYPKQCIEPS